MDFNGRSRTAGAIPDIIDIEKVCGKEGYFES